MNVQISPSLQLSIISRVKIENSLIPSCQFSVAKESNNGIEESERVRERERERHLEETHDMSMAHIERMVMLEWRERERGREGGREREGAEQRGIELVTLETWQLADKQRQGKWVGQVDRRTNGRTTSRLGVGGYQLWTGDFGTKNESQKRENDLNRASPHFSSSLICSVHTTHTHTHTPHAHARALSLSTDVSITLVPRCNIHGPALCWLPI